VMNAFPEMFAVLRRVVTQVDLPRLELSLPGAPRKKKVRREASPTLCLVSSKLMVHVAEVDIPTIGRTEMPKDEKEKRRKKLDEIQNLMESVCSLYTRVAQQLGVTRSFVSRVARGERSSAIVEQTVIREFDDIV
jgi:hypothetical protein